MMVEDGGIGQFFYDAFHLSYFLKIILDPYQPTLYTDTVTLQLTIVTTNAFRIVHTNTVPVFLRSVFIVEHVSK